MQNHTDSSDPWRYAEPHRLEWSMAVCRTVRVTGVRTGLRGKPGAKFFPDSHINIRTSYRQSHLTPTSVYYPLGDKKRLVSVGIEQSKFYTMWCVITKAELLRPLACIVELKIFLPVDSIQPLEGLAPSSVTPRTIATASGKFPHHRKKGNCPICPPVFCTRPDLPGYLVIHPSAHYVQGFEIRVRVSVS
jgi:hypothetical protein